MNHQFEIQPRKRLRMANCSYQSNGYYFVTICTQNREHLFGKIIKNKMYLNPAGKMVTHILKSVHIAYDGWSLDTQIVMPNHIHAIFGLNLHGMDHITPLSLPELIRNIKSLTTTNYARGVTAHNWQPFNYHLWQRSYHESIIRGEHNLHNIRKYIQNNPANWQNDKNNR